MKKTRIFIDPASKSSGWAIFTGNEFKGSFTIKVEDKNPFKRLDKLHKEILKQLKTWDKIEEAHIEMLNYGVHYACLWSVGVIGQTLQSLDIDVYQDINVTSWQKACNWVRIKDLWKDMHAPTSWKSEDEWAAYTMGAWWLSSKGMT